jgi:hypothetical protein
MTFVRRGDFVIILARPRVVDGDLMLGEWEFHALCSCGWGAIIDSDDHNDPKIVEHSDSHR